MVIGSFGTVLQAALAKWLVGSPLASAANRIP